MFGPAGQAPRSPTILSTSPCGRRTPSTPDCLWKMGASISPGSLERFGMPVPTAGDAASSRGGEPPKRPTEAAQRDRSRTATSFSEFPISPVRAHCVSGSEADPSGSGHPCPRAGISSHPSGLRPQGGSGAGQSDCSQNSSRGWNGKPRWSTAKGRDHEW